jgi:hypothetical protein
MVFLISAGCDNAKDNINLWGEWVEITQKKDTIVFTYFGSNQAFNLKRGYVMQSGHPVPKGEIYYYIVLKSDSIALNPITSSICPLPDPDCYPHFFFKLKSGNTFEIGNFYDSKSGANGTFTFARIK